MDSPHLSWTMNLRAPAFSKDSPGPDETRHLWTRASAVSAAAAGRESTDGTLEQSTDGD